MRSSQRRFTWIFFGIVFACILATGSSGFGAVLYVVPAPGGNDGNTGLDWAHAKATVSGAIAAAAEGDEIWVKAGTYAEHIQNRIADESPVNVALYGGFAGNESTRAERDWKTNATVLDGEGSGVVVTIAGGLQGGAGSGTRVDGFRIIRGGEGGIVISGSAPVIANNVIQGNGGPGITVSKYQILQIEPPVVAHPTLTRNTIVDNQASDGAGIVVVGDLVTNLVPAPPSAPTITYNVIARNTASMNGGGIGCWGHTAAVITNNFILANSASNYEPGWDGDDPIGPWLVGGGGIFATARDMGGSPVEYAISAPTIANNVVAVNGALLGGGICLVSYALLSEPNNPPAVVTNNTVVANNGSGIYIGDTFPTVRNNLVAFNTWGIEQDTTATPTLGYNDVYGNQVQGTSWNYKGLPDPTGTNGNLSVDPKLANTAVGELHLQPGSPCIDAGLTDVVDPLWKDIDGQNRVLGAGVDIGADESNGRRWRVPMPVIYVRTDGSDANDGSSWTAARKTVAAGISKAAETGGEVWVAKGTYPEHIVLPAYVYLYGGFDGTETARGARNVEGNPTILDGGGVPTIVLSRNAGYLVSALDGFTVQNGGVYLGGDQVPGASDGVEGRGGGIRSVVTSLTIANSTVRRNSFGNPFDTANKRGCGAGVHGYISHSVLDGNVFTENEILNTFDGSGAGMYFKLSMPTISGNTLSNNASEYGSAIYSTTSIPRIVGNTIENNAMYNTYPLPLYMGSAHGAVTIDTGEDFLVEANVIRGNTAAYGAGLYVTSQRAGRIRNNLITGNRAYDPTAGGGSGGGIYCEVGTDAVDNVAIVNNTIVGNTATYDSLSVEQGGGIAIALPYLPPTDASTPGKLLLADNILAFNSSGIFLPPDSLKPVLYNNDLFNTGANYTNLPAGTTDISTDPLFADLNGPDGDPATTADNDYRLKAYSPCIDKGSTDTSYLSATDFAGNPRVLDGDRNGSAIVDMGAYEFVFTGPGIKVDFNGDGKADVLLRYMSTGRLTRVWLMDGTARASTGAPGGLPLDWKVGPSGDFDGNGTSDLLWENASLGRVSIWLMAGGQKAQSATLASPGEGWSVAAAGDFDGDGRGDIFWRNGVSGALRVWLMDGMSPVNDGSPGTLPSSWALAGTCDFDGNGTLDLLWVDAALGKATVWLMNGTTKTPSARFSTGGEDWFMAGIGDFNGDGRSDILWRNKVSGRLRVWLMNGTTRASVGSPGIKGLEWSVIDTADFDGDGKSDILWHSATLGKASVWLVNGTQKGLSSILAAPGLDWRVRGVGDYNADGKTDVLWHNSKSGRTMVWLMNGKTRAGVGSPGIAVAPWEIQ